MRTVTLEPISHTYSDELGREYTSATRFLGSYKEAFNANLIAPLVAKSRKKKFTALAAKKSVSIKEIQAMQPVYERGYTVKAILAEWDAKRDDANARGNQIHDNLEAMLLTGKIAKDEYTETYKEVWKFIKAQEYHKLFPEVVLHSERIMIAGMADLRAQRTKSKNSVVDYYDYKTNVIKYDSSSVKDNKKKQNNKFMLYPLEHLEECNFNSYALQLSLYAYMDQMMYGTKIGRLAIINVNDGCEIIPVPYMKMEIELLFRHKEMRNERAE